MRLQTEESILRVNKSNITGENTFDENHFEIEASDGSSKDEKTFWVFFFSRFVTSALTLRPLNKNIYVFLSIVWFLKF